jgi:hypothetical protein
MSWLDITDELTEEGKALPVGRVLMFSKVDLKIMRKKNGKVWAKRVYLYHPEEVEIKDKVEM